MCTPGIIAGACRQACIVARVASGPSLLKPFGTTQTLKIELVEERLVYYKKPSKGTIIDLADVEVAAPAADDALGWYLRMRDGGAVPFGAQSTEARAAWVASVNIL